MHIRSPWPISIQEYTVLKLACQYGLNWINKQGKTINSNTCRRGNRAAWTRIHTFSRLFHARVTSNAQRPMCTAPMLSANGKTGIFQSLWGNRWMFGVDGWFPFQSVSFCSANLHSVATGIQVAYRMAHPYLSGNGKDKSTVVHLSNSCFGNKLPSHFQSTTVIQVVEAGPSSVNLPICLGLALIDSAQSSCSLGIKNKRNLPNWCWSNIQWFPGSWWCNNLQEHSSTPKPSDTCRKASSSLLHTAWPKNLGEDSFL